MTSKSLYSKLMREDLKNRLWTVALIGLGCFFLYPVVAAFTADKIRDYLDFEAGVRNYSRDLILWLSFKNGATVFAMMVASLICGLSGFSYLNSRSKVDFYHSIPVRREKLYLVNYVDGILILAVPYALSLVMAVIVGITNGVDGSSLWPVAAAAYGLHMTYFILMYSTVIIAVMLTGNLVVAFFGSLVLTFYLPVAVSLVQSYAMSFFDTFMYRGNGIMSWLIRISPVVEYVVQVGEYAGGEVIWPEALAALAVSPLLAVIGCLLYKKRPSEAAGKAVAFAATRPVIRILITLAAALGFGVFFWGMRESMGWAVFGIICGAVISHCVIEIIYHFDFKKLFCNKGQLVGCILVSLAVLFAFRYDLMGHDRYLPAAGQVKEAAIVIEQFGDWVSYGHTELQNDGSYEWKWDSGEGYVMKHMRHQDIENLLAVAAEGVGQTADRKREREQQGGRTEMAEVVMAEENGVPSVGGDNPLGRENYVCIRYTMNNGRQVFRRYYMNLQPVRSQVEKLYNSEQYQKGTFPLMTRTADQVFGIRYRENGEEVRIDGLTESQKKEFLEAYQQEFAAMTLTRMEQEYPVGLIRFTLNEDEAAMEWWQNESRQKEADYRYYRSASEFERRDFYPVYPSFTKTLGLLRENGVEPGSYNMDIEVSAVTVCTDMEDGDRNMFTITDPEEIHELMQAAVESGLGYYNPMFRLDDTYLELTFSEEDALTRTYDSRVCFPKGKLPGFLQERLEKYLK